jgi:hypothetical protein
MKKALVMVIFIMVLFNSCAYIGVRDRSTDSAQNPVVSPQEYSTARSSTLLLTEALFYRKASSTAVRIEGTGTKLTARFDKLDLSQVLFPDGMSVLDWGMEMGLIPQKDNPLQDQRIILTGYLDQSSGKDLNVRLIVDGTDFYGRFLFEMEMDTIKGEWSVRINGVPYYS